MDQKSFITLGQANTDYYKKSEVYTKTECDNKFSQKITYSTSEVDTGNKWIDGKTIYRKVISKNNVYIAKDETIAHGISNFNFLVNSYGVIHDTSDQNSRPFPLFSVDGAPNGFKVNNTNIVFTGSDTWSAATTKTYYFILEYTKTA